MTLLHLTTGFLLWMCCATHKASAGAACEDPPLIEFGKIVSGVKSEYEENDRVQYTCDPGYALSGSEWVTCHGKVWMPGPPQCLERPCGSIPAVANAAFEGRSKEKYEPGETVRYQCHEGFQVTGPPEIFCRRGNWSTPPICEEKDRKCGPPPDIEYGDILSFPLPEYDHGKTVKYKCPSFYILEGPEQITCINGLWTNPPVCLAACTASEEDMDRNNIELRWRGERKLYSTSGDFVEFDCKIGHVQDPASSPFRVQCMDGTLEYPRCKPGIIGLPGEGGKCGPPPDIENGDILSFQLKQYPQGAMLKYKCASFYILKGPEQITCTDGQWTNPPVCLAACTTSEEDMDRNNIELTWSGERKLYLKSGDFVEFDCKIGYVQDPASSPFRVQCMDGTLEYPRCKPGNVTCEPPPEIAGGKVQGVKKPRYLPGETAHYQCWQGFQMTGASTVTCKNGTWTERPQCKEKPCDYPVIENGKISERMAHSYFPMRIGQYVDYHCRNGYLAPNGGRVVRIYCSKGGWNPEPKCLKTCSVTHLENGYFRYNRYTYTEGERIQYVCNQDYRTESAGGEVTCTKNGWSPFPRCIRKSFQMTGASTVTCQNGTWTERPQCKDVTCEPPPEIAGGKVQGVKKPRYLPGETAHYQCWQGFQMTGASTVTCQNGTWTERPQCKGKSRKCGPPPDIENGDILSFPLPEYDQGQTVKYKCPSFYILKGPEQITCTDGQWTNPPVCLAACTASEEDMDRNNIEQRWREERKLYSTSGDFIEFDCKIGHVQDPASSPFRVQCMDGTLEYPRCKPGKILCSPPRVPNGNFRPQEDSYREGATITIDCNPGYHLRTLSGKNTARCTSRGWVPAPDCVQKPCDYPVIENGKISERMAHSYFPMRIGQYVDYHCRNGYLAPNGGRVVRIYCSKGGWNPEPKCLKTCFVTHLENGYFRYNRYTYTEGERIQYVCNQDYRTESAGGEVTCTKNGWSPFPRCIRKMVCTASEEDMDRNNIELIWRGERKLYSTSGGFTEFDCKIGYVQDPASSPFRVQCMDGTLEYPRCKPGNVTCEPPPEIAGGKVQGVKKPRYLPGETAHYQCWQGFQMTGASTVTCQNGTWTGRPQCKVIGLPGEGGKCGPPPDIENGDILSFQLKQYPQGAMLKYKCASFYILKGPEQITCTDGQWTNPPVCLAACTASEEDMDRNNIELRWRGERKLYSTSGDFIEFDCKIGYVQDPASSPFRVQCMDGTLEYPRCKPGIIGLPGEGGKCGPPPDIENGDILSFQLKQYPQGVTLKYKCASFYILKGPEQITCIDGQWTNPPVCLAACTASEDDMDRNNIELRWRGERKLYSTSGDFVEFDCKIGYVQDPASSPFRVQCMDGTLEYPRCKPGIIGLPGEGGKCGPPPDIENGDILSFQLKQYPEGATLKYKCASFYILKGPEQITCIDGQWTNPPVCLAACTTSEEDMDRNNIELKWSGERKTYLKSGDFVEFDCKIGYVQDPASSPFRVQCMDGTLEYPRCKPGKDCTVLETAMESNNIKLRQPRRRSYTYRSEEYILFTCKDSYHEVSNPEDFNAQCQDGVINYPRCEKILCSPPRVPNGNFRPQEDSYREGATITIDCNPGYHLRTLSGKNTARCTSRGWVPAPDCVEKPCDYPVIENGKISERMAHSYFPMRIGQYVDYHCRNGYLAPNGGRVVRIYCSKGGWNPEPKCLKTCFVTHLENGYFRYNRYTYTEGERIQYVCNQDYRTESAGGEVTCTKNGWSPFPRCIRKKTCQSIVLDNASFPLARGTFALQAKVTYTCHDGFVTPEGKDRGETRCQENGWTPTPKCIRSCEKPNVHILDDHVDKSVFLPGDTIAYSCPEGFQTADNMATGTTSCEINGEWKPAPRCLAIECETPILPNGSISPRKDKYSNGDVVKFFCEKKYKRVGPASAQCYYFGWSPSPPACKAPSHRCVTPVDVEVVQPSYFSEPKKETEPHGVIRYKCTSADNNIKEATCVSGKWSPEIDCTGESTCPPPPQLHGAKQIPAERNYKNGSKITFSCLESFQLIGGNEITCINGRWQSPPRCVENPCLPPQPVEYVDDLRLENQNLKMEKEGKTIYLAGATLNVVCRPGYKLDGPSKITCSMGNWTSAPTCSERPCGSIPAVANAAFEGRSKEKYEPGETIRYQCHEGFKATGLPEIFCRRGTWSTPPICEDVSCGPPPEILNAHITSTQQQRYLPGAKVHYECESNSQIMGVNYVTCSDGHWTKVPSCRDVTCEPPPEIAGGKVQGVKKPRYLPGETAHYQCWQGFQMTGASTVTCQNGTWTEQPQCKGKGRKCVPPPDIENGDILSFPLPEYDQGQIVKYKCASFYILKGPEQITCIDGQWTNPPVCLAACTASEEDMDRNNIELRWRGERKLYSTSGDFIEFDCKIGYVQDPASSPFRVQCMDGTLEYPRCKPGIIGLPGEGGKCGPPPDIENGDILSFQLKQYPEGATLKYKCASFYILKGPEQITCIDGQWTNPPVCLAACTTSEEDMDRNNIELKWSGERKLYLKSGDFVEFDCKIGYVQDPASSPFRVQCMDGTLEYPRCKPGKDCTVLETAMESNNIKLRQPRRRSYTYRSEEYILFTCKDSYHEVSNPEDFNAQCQDGVINYPRCENVTCEPPPEIAGGKVQGVKKPRYLPGETAHYQCWQGFQMTGASTVTCQNGTWTEQPQCKAFCTTSKEDMNRNNIELKWVVQRNLSIKSGNFIEFDCKIGYVQDPASSPFRVQCMDGTLEYPRCKPGTYFG
eukprot:XP_027319150.1 complement receptor type 1 isoform X14 [Anas platyrhynchos]